ncbi:MAG: right-handed parallel beta-helix repeat-containing protein [Methylocella sp.]
MTRNTFSQLIAGAFISLCLATAPARALSDHTYVSGKGTDTGGCTAPATPCRTFAFAIAQTAASGTIIAIDPANYGPVTITKSISIVADGGGPAGIFITTGTAITISAGASIIVNLRGLTLDGSGTASVGISGGFASSTSDLKPAATITDCFIRHFSGDGISLGGAATVKFRNSNTVSSDNGGHGLFATFAFLPFNGVLDRFTASGDNIGIDLESRETGIDVTIVDSVVANNFSDGLRLGAPGIPGSTAVATLAGSIVTKNGGTGVNISPGSTVFSYGDNEINGNVTDVVGTLTPLAKKW